MFFVQINHTGKGFLFLIFREIKLRKYSSLHKLFYGLDNYYRDVSRFINYVKKNNVKFISVSKAKWTYKDLIVTASPEVGMKIGDEEYSVKIYYKVKKETEKWLAKNIAPTLNLMRSANPMEKKTFAILNLQNGRLYSEDKFSRDPLELEVDADTLLDIWQKI